MQDDECTDLDPAAVEEVVEEVVESVEIDADPDDVWRSLADAEQLGGWLGEDLDLEVEVGATGGVTDDDGRRRRVEVIDVEPERRRIAWRWSSGRDDRPAWSTVEIEVLPRPGGSEVRVVERVPVPVMSASLRPGASTPAREVARSRASSWCGRLLDLELRHLRVPRCIAVG